jgi:hypothetical protein
VTSISQDDDDWVEVSNNGSTGSAVLELRRQTRLFQVSVWAGVYDRRDAVGAAIDAGLAAVSRVVLADGSCAIMTYDTSAQNDEQQQAGVYRRELLYALNYATTLVRALTAIAATETHVTPGVHDTDIATISIVS